MFDAQERSPYNYTTHGEWFLNHSLNIFMKINVLILLMFTLNVICTLTRFYQVIYAAVLYYNSGQYFH